MKLKRTIERWRNCDPHAMATRQSPAAIEYAFSDARHDVLALHAVVVELRERLRACSGWVEAYGEQETKNLFRQVLAKAAELEL